MKKIISSLVLLLIIFASKGQNVGIGTNTPDPSAKLDITSTNSGFLPPRMTTLQRNSINNPAPGLQIYNTTNDCLEIFGRGKWNAMYCIPIDSIIATDIDGHTYPTTQICNQTWMAKNLDVSRYRNGDTIPQVTDPTEWANLTTGAWCYYNNDAANGSIYGKLYNWYAVNDPRGLAPQGWHLPSEGEWNTLVKCIDPAADTAVCQGCIQSTTAGNAMKEIGTSHWPSPNTGATNSSGFAGLPGGGRNYPFFNSSFDGIGYSGSWWSSTQFDTSTRSLCLSYSLSHEDGSIGVWRSGYKTLGHSFRCVKDTPITTLNDGLVAYYPFNGNANDESGNGNNGTVNGATLTTDRFGNSSKAYSFDGISDYVLVNNSQSIDITGSQITISYWLKFENNLIGENYQGVSKCGWDCGAGYELIFRNAYGGDTGVVNLTSGSGGFIAWNGIANYQNRWLNLTATFYNGIGKIYYNGILQNTTSNGVGISSLNSSLNNLYIGTRDPINLNVGFIDGSLDDIRIYNRALTQEEITYLAEH